MKLEAVNDQHCFCCGRENDLGLKLTFSYPEPGQARTLCTIPEYFSGWRGATHGGFLAMLLDEIMAHACVSADALAVTAEMTVRYRNPVLTGETVWVYGEIEAKRSRIIEAAGRITRENGQVVAEAKGRFLKAPA